MKTNFYHSYHTDIKVRVYSKTKQTPLWDCDSLKSRLQQIDLQNKTIHLLAGRKLSSISDSFVHSLDNPYTDYGNLKTTTVTKKVKVDYVDNSGPCTANTEVDSSIDLDYYINKAIENNRTYIENVGDEFEFMNLQHYDSVGDSYTEALTLKYTYLKEEASKHADPELYIKDKYTNPDSPFYASDLTDAERWVAYSCEKDMLKYGRLRLVYYQDSLFRDKNLKVGSMTGDEKRFNRKVMNQQLNNKLENNGISIPNGVTLGCTIDPKTCYISIVDKTNDGTNRINLCKEYYQAFADKAEDVGFDGFMDMYLSIDITSEGFQDVNQNINWSNDEDPIITRWLSESEYSTL